MTLTLQDVAGGRFMLGVGSGWLEEEFVALGVPFAERRARFDEALAVLRAAWAGGRDRASPASTSPSSTIVVTPEPVHVPLILGGNTEPALRRAATVADGWFSSGNPTFDEAVRLRDRLAELAAQADRAAPLDGVRAHGRTRPDELDRYAEHGFAHVTVWANQLWPAEGDMATKQAVRLAAAALPSADAATILMRIDARAVDGRRVERSIMFAAGQTMAGG